MKARNQNALLVKKNATDSVEAIGSTAAGKLISSDGTFASPGSDNYTLFKCSWCNSKFRSLVSLNRHIYLKHSIVYVEYIRERRKIPMVSLRAMLGGIPDTVKTVIMGSEMELEYIVDSSCYEEITVDGKYIDSRMAGCRTKEVLLFHKDVGRECECGSVIPYSCNVRMCVKCEQTRRNRISKEHSDAVMEFDRAVAMTLTYRGHHSLSKERKKDMERDIRNLMKRIIRKFPQNKIQYVRVLELELKPDGYYYHYHFLIDMPFLPQEHLSKMWHEVTGDSFVVDIRILKDKNNKPIGAYWNKLPKKVKANNMLGYISKYLAKPVKGVSSDEYAKLVYGTHFVEKHFTCLSAVSRPYFARRPQCRVCGETLFYAGTRPISTGIT